MSDTTTATPADVAKAQEPAQAPTAPEPTKPDTKSDDTDWKAEARKWEQRAKDNAKRAEDAGKTEAEKNAERLAEVEKRAAEAEARVLRREVALDPTGDGKSSPLSKADAALLDAITDEKAMKALAARLASESDKKRNHVPREGNNPETASDDRRDFVRRLTGRS